MCGYFCIEFINYMLKGKTFELLRRLRTIELLKEYLKNE